MFGVLRFDVLGILGQWEGQRESFATGRYNVAETGTTPTGHRRLLVGGRVWDATQGVPPHPVREPIPHLARSTLLDMTVAISITYNLERESVIIVCKHISPASGRCRFLFVAAE